jgi:hypothetical protein
MFVKMVLPTPGFSEAPITAIDLGEKKIDLDMMRMSRFWVVIKVSSYRDGLLLQAWELLFMSSGILLLIVLPAVIAFAFGVFVMASILPDVEDRLYYYYGYPDARQLIIDQQP